MLTGLYKSIFTHVATSRANLFSTKENLCIMAQSIPKYPSPGYFPFFFLFFFFWKRCKCPTVGPGGNHLLINKCHTCTVKRLSYIFGKTLVINTFFKSFPTHCPHKNRPLKSVISKIRILTVWSEESIQSVDFMDSSSVFESAQKTQNLC